MGTNILGLLAGADRRLYLSFAAYFEASPHAWQTEAVAVAVFRGGAGMNTGPYFHLHIGPVAPESPG